MLTLTQQRERARAVEEVLKFMRRRGLSLDDLVEVGGQDFRSTNPKRVEKAHRVEKTWSLMARLGVKHGDLESNWPPAAVSMPARRRRRPRHSTVNQQALEIAGVSLSEPASTKPNEINDLANSVPVDEPGTNLAASDQPHGGADAMPGAGSVSFGR
jgi:hypothetical protein